MQSHRDVRKTRRWGGWPLAAAAIGAFLLMGTTAAPAQADSTFERGFQDQLGRILAFEAVNLGKNVLHQGLAQPYRGAHSPSYDRGDHRSYVRYEGHHGHAKHHWKSRRRHHKRHDRWRERDHGSDYSRDRHNGDRRRGHRRDRPRHAS